jgi:hypothetical protein
MAALRWVVGQVRHQLELVAAMWLIVRIATLAVAPTELWAARTGADAAACQCADDAGALCPMHHPATPRRSTCTVRGVAPVDGVAFTSLFSVDGCLTAGPDVPRDASPASAAPLGCLQLSSRFTPPDPRPPRT